jgi:hypothetical protein
VKDGSVEIKVARRDADVKFYRYAREKEVSIFDLDDKVNEMKETVEAAVASAVASQNTAVKTVSEMNAAFVTGVAKQMSETVSGVEGDVSDVQGKLTAVQTAMTSLKSEINAKVAADGVSLKEEVTESLSSGAKKTDDAIKAASVATKAQVDGLASAVTASFTAACLAGGQKYNANTKKCEGESATAGDGSTPESAATSCKALKVSNNKLKSGLYWIRPTKQQAPTQSYCEMAYGSGGWTLVASVNEGDIKCRGCADDRWSNPNMGQSNDGNDYQAKNGGHRPWETASTFGTAAAASNDDFKSSLYSSMPGVTDMMVMVVPNDTPMAQWTAKASVIQHSTTGFLYGTRSW